MIAGCARSCPPPGAPRRRRKGRVRRCAATTTTRAWTAARPAETRDGPDRCASSRRLRHFVGDEPRIDHETPRGGQRGKRDFGARPVTRELHAITTLEEGREQLAVLLVKLGSPGGDR